MAPADTTVTETIAGKDAEDRVAVASNWRLVWWRFRRHHLAMASAGLLIFLYLIVLVPDFFSTQDPERTDARQAFIPVQMVHFFDDGRLSPWVPAIVGKRNPTTLRMEWVTDPQKKVPVRFFAPGFSYRVFGLFESNLHLIVPADPDAAHLPAGLRPPGTRSVVAHHARHADLDDRRPGGGGVERHPGRRAGRHLGLCRRQDRPGDPAPDRAAAIRADHPDLAGALRPPCRATGRPYRSSSPSP